MTDFSSEQRPEIEDLEREMNAEASWYEAAKLHDRNDRCWGVVGAPYGAIAEAENGSLLMRLTETEARDMAQAMTEALPAAKGSVAPLVVASFEAAPVRRAVGF